MGSLNALNFPTLPDPTTVEQVAEFKKALEILAERFNLFSALSSLPTGIPSLMAARMPLDSPLGPAGMIEVQQPFPAAFVWVGLTALGLGLGALFQVGIARQIAPKADLPTGWAVWTRFILFALVVYGGLALISAGSILLATLATLVLPIIGLGIAFLSLSFTFWLAIYLAFTPHGIVRYRLGVLKAMAESVLLVRVNLLATVGFLGVAFGLTWLTNQVWVLPEETSWLSMLAVAGHAFVSATMLAASFAFYQGRREWLMAVRQRALSAVLPPHEGPPSGEV
jgi:hypothetical protein